MLASTGTRRVVPGFRPATTITAVESRSYLGTHQNRRSPVEADDAVPIDAERPPGVGDDDAVGIGHHPHAQRPHDEQGRRHRPRCVGSDIGDGGFGERRDRGSDQRNGEETHERDPREEDEEHQECGWWRPEALPLAGVADRVPPSIAHVARDGTLPRMAEDVTGTLALMGGEEYEEPARPVDEELLQASGASEVVVVPTAAAYENPAKVVERATAWFEGLGASASAVMVLHHKEADDAEAVQAVRDARFVSIPGGSPMHLRSVLHGSALWEAILHAYRSGATISASGSGAVVLCNPMIDPRGGAYTVGLGLLANLTVFAHRDTVAAHLWERAVDLRPADTVLAGIDEHTALVRSSDGSWRVAGPGHVVLCGPDGETTHTAGPVPSLTI